MSPTDSGLAARIGDRPQESSRKVYHKHRPNNPQSVEYSTEHVPGASLAERLGPKAQSPDSKVSCGKALRVRDWREVAEQFDFFLLRFFPTDSP